MTDGPRTLKVSKAQATAFLAKAEGFLRGGQSALAAGEETSAGVLAIHAGIAACDPLTIHFLGLRSRGQRHQEVLGLLERLSPEVRGDVGRQLRRLLDEKNVVEYDDQILSRGDGAEMIKLAERIAARVRASVK